MIVFFTILVLIATLIILLVKWLQEQNSYWERLNVKHLKPRLFFGNSYEALIGVKHPAEIIENAYLKFPNEEVIGYYEYLHPALIIRAPELIEKVLIKDFTHFTDRVGSSALSKNPLTTNLFNMCGTQWQIFRAKLNPLFENRKLKYMYEPLSECGRNLSSILDANVGKEVDMKEIMSLFSMDVIGSCAFGIDAGVLQNPSSNFRAMGKKMFDHDITQYFRIVLMTIAPKIAAKFQVAFVKPHIIKYFCDIINNTLNFRKKHGVERHDFVQMLMQLKESGNVKTQNQDSATELSRADMNNGINGFTITDELLMGTAFGFLSAGFHTIASTLTYALYELSQQPDVLYRVRREIKDQVTIHGDITFDALKCMIYLEKVLKDVRIAFVKLGEDVFDKGKMHVCRNSYFTPETMRLHPAALYITRVCTKAYKFPSGLTVNPGDSVIIPVLALHRDPFLHEDSYTFNPSRFDSPPPVGTYLPFGEGPRMCIAMKFAVLEMKYAISKILLNYDIQLSRRANITLKMEPRRYLNTPKDEIIMRITKI